MPIVKFTALTALGSTVWNAALIGAGWALGEHYEKVGGIVGPIGTAVVGGDRARDPRPRRPRLRERRTGLVRQQEPQVDVLVAVHDVQERPGRHLRQPLDAALAGKACRLPTSTTPPPRWPGTSSSQCSQCACPADA